MAITKKLTTPPEPPQRSDPETFADRADAFVSWIVQFRSDLEVWAFQANTTESNINSLESKTETYKNQTEQFRNEAFALYNAGLYDPNKSYSYPDCVIGSDGHIYRCLGTNVQGDDPVTSTTGNWTRVTANADEINDLRSKVNGILDGSVQIDPDSIPSNSISTTKIIDSAVTNSKIADNSITANKISNASVTEEKLADKACSGNKLKIDYVTWHASSIPTTSKSFSGLNNGLYLVLATCEAVYSSSTKTHTLTITTSTGDYSVEAYAYDGGADHHIHTLVNVALVGDGTMDLSWDGYHLFHVVLIWLGLQ